MKTSGHFFIGDRVSVRCPQAIARAARHSSNTRELREVEVPWLSGQIIARDVNSPIAQGPRGATTRYVVQLDDQRRVVAYDEDVRRWTLVFDLLETLEKMAS